MIARIWHGWTKPEDAEKYERFLNEVIFPELAAKGGEGYKKVQLLRHPLKSEVEFVTIMWFDSWDAVKAFAGEEYTMAYVPKEAKKILSRFEKESTHYEMIGNLTY